MPRSATTYLALLVGVVLATLWAFNWLLGQRFSSGEAYPPSSTLRADPLGAKAIYEALDRLPGKSCERHFRSLSKLDGSRDKMLLCLHVSPGAFHDGDDLDGEGLLKFVAAGGRALITLDGQKSDWQIVKDAADKRRDENRERRIEEQKKLDSKDEKKGEKEASSPRKDPAKEKDSRDPDQKKDEDKAKSAREIQRDRQKALLSPPKSLGETLGISIHQENFVMTAKGALMLDPEPAFPLPATSLPGWYTRTAITFNDEKLGQSGHDDQAEDDGSEASTSRWEILAKYKDDIMLAQRRYGAGTVILATDSYFASNEALFKEPAASFLAWLIGGASTIIFDESHLGSNENPGVMALARRYHLHGLFFGGLLLFGLFVWKSSVSLVPSQDEQEGPEIVAGQGAAAGLVSMLRRGVALPQVLRRGLEAWLHGSPRPNAATQARIERAKQVLPPENARRAKSGAVRDIYRQICQALHTTSR